MSTGLTVRSTGSSAQASLSRPNSTSIPQAVSTDLPAAQAVTAAAGVTGARNDPTGASLSDPSHLRDIILDPHSREVIDRSVNAGPRRVVRQVPEVAARRLKAYTRFAKGGASRHEHQADIET
jgi:hypothetical protein